jgi:hypothetical protein
MFDDDDGKWIPSDMNIMEIGFLTLPRQKDTF